MRKNKLKIKKAVNGLQDIAVPEQGSYSNVLSSTSSLASAGSQFGPIGGLIGAAAGLGLGFLQKSKQDQSNRNALALNRDKKMNRAYAGDEETINQAPQRFSNGGKVKTKIIEIEGKKTPEIHTDKNFNVKNLGTIPHTQGGNKVEAEEGDIIFNTQNSLSKYNKIASALQEGDKSTLNKEKNKLPEDKGMKNQTGNKGVKDNRPFHYNSYGDKIYDKGYEVRTQPSTSSKRPTNPNKPLDVFGVRDFFTPKPFTPDAKLADGSKTTSPTKITTTNNDIPKTSAKEVFNSGYKLPSQSGYVAPKPATKASIKSTNQAKASKKATPISQVLSTPSQVGKFSPGSINEPDLSDLKGSRSLDQVAESAKGMKILDTSSKANSSPSQSTSPTSNTNTGQGLNNVLQFAGVANNLFQGLKGEQGIDESYYNPDKIKYQDRSQGLRNQSNQAMNAQISNARNLSGGNVGNLRANSNAARLSNLATQGGIDEREQARADTIANQNTEISNQAKQINLGRKDNYQQQIMANRAAKQSYIDQAASDIGQYGMAKREENYMRSRDDKAELAQEAGYRSINSRYQHKSNLDGSTYFEPDADSSITRFGTSGGNRGRKKVLGVFKKGTKAIKTKSVV